MFGKIMSVSDELMWRYFELLSFRPSSEIESLKQDVDQGANPRDVKFQLAFEIVARFHSHELAGRAKYHFVERFQKRTIPEDIREVSLQAPDGEIPIPNVLKEAGLVSSTTEARRMIKQRAVRIEGQRVRDTELRIGAGTTQVYQVGKRRFALISVK
jgi:tyrosyl-tRNA synthetase